MEKYCRYRVSWIKIMVILTTFVFPTIDNRQDYYDELDNYNGAQDTSYNDNYYPEAEMHNSPAMYGIWRGPSPPPRYPHVKMCPCRQVEQRQQLLPVNCPTGAAFIDILTNLGVNFWSLVQLIFAASVPLILPLLILKFFIVIFKLYKFIKAVKLILKIAILLPFLMRVILPAIQNLLNQQSIIHLLKMRSDDRFLNDKQLLVYWKLDDLMSTAEMVSCASKSACEIGSYFAIKSYDHLPEKFNYILQKKVEQVDNKSKIVDKDYNKQIFNAFIVAYAKNWTYDRCKIYSCSITL